MAALYLVLCSGGPVQSGGSSTPKTIKQTIFFLPRDLIREPATRDFTPIVISRDFAPLSAMAVWLFFHFYFFFPHLLLLESLMGD